MLRPINGRERVLYLAGILSACGTLTIMEAVAEIVEGLHGRPYTMTEDEKAEYEAVLFAMVGV